MSAIQIEMTREKLTTLTSSSIVADMVTPIDEVAESSAKLIEAIASPRSFDSRLVAYERTVRKAIPVDVSREGPLARVAELMPLDRAVIATRVAAEDALQAAVDEAKATGLTWDELRPILRIRGAQIGATHERWAARNPDRARVTYRPEKVGLTKFVVKRPSEMTRAAALRLVERAQLALEAHQRAVDLVRNELWRTCDLALASKRTLVELAEVTGFAESAVHKGHANWAALNHRIAKVQARPYDQRRALAMQALRSWAKENSGALPTGLKMWNDVPVGKKVRDFRHQYHKGRLDPDIHAELCELFGEDWTVLAPVGSPLQVERIIAGRYPDS